MGFIAWLNKDEVRLRIKKNLRPIYRLLKNKYVNLVLKILVAVGLIYTIYHQVFARDNIDELWTEFLNRFTIDNAWWLGVATLLMPINWALETLKWQVLLQRVEKVPFLRAYKGILMGITLSVFTPNRVGEYGGRILVVKPENNWKTVVATLVSSFSQLVALLSLGILGLLYFSYYHLEQEGLLLAGVGLLGIALILFMLLCFYNVNLAIPIFKKLPYLRRFIKHMQVLEQYSFHELSQALLIAIIRYAVYTFQYYLLLRFFGIPVPFWAGVSGIATIFLLQTSVPLPAIADLFVRSEVALYIWGIFSGNDISILASTFGLWFINLIIPAMLGMLFAFTVNITQSLGYEKKIPSSDK